MSESSRAKRDTIAVSGGVILGAVAAMVVSRLFFGKKSDSPSREGISAEKIASAPVVSPGATLTVATPGPRYHPGILRIGHTRNAKRVALLNTGTVVKIVDSARDERGNLWYHVAVPGGQSGWMSGHILA